MGLGRHPAAFCTGSIPGINGYLALLPVVRLGVGWGSTLGLPYILVASVVPRDRMGVYVGIVT